MDELQYKELLKVKKRKYRLIAVLSSIFFFLTGSVSTLALYNHFFGGALNQSEISPFQQAYNIIKNEWYFGSDEITEQYFNEGMQGLVNGRVDNAVSRIDPYLVYYPKAETTIPTYGIGIEVLTDGYGYGLYDGYYYVTKVYGYSAASGVLKEGDLISKVNGESIRYKHTDSLNIKGEKGTDVTISYIRNGQEYTHTFKRQEAVEHTVESELHVNYAVLTIDGFTTNTTGQLGTADLAKEKLEEIKREGISNLLIDLRDNPGGYIAAFKELADLFMESNKSLGNYINKHKDIIESPKTKDNQKYEFENIIILVNGSSASASESFTASMMDNLDNVTVVGTTSYGKGIAQRTITLNDGSSLKYTYAEYIRPNGEKLHKIGVVPETIIELRNYQSLNRNDYIVDNELNMEEFCLAGKNYYEDKLAAYEEQLLAAAALFN